MHPNPLTFSARLWQQIETVYEEILAHPFLTGLTDGTLDEKTFAHYVAQDVHYLRDYARALSIVAAKAPTLADTAMFARHAAEVFDVELGLHGELLPELGLDAATLEPSRSGRPPRPTPVTCSPPPMRAASPTVWLRCCRATGSMHAWAPS